MKTYSELIRLPSFEERFEYLRTKSKIGQDTFGFDRYLNQVFYKSPEWRRVRRDIIIRDDGCDLADTDRPIAGRILIHHLNPITMDDIVNRSQYALNPEYLVCVSFDTHNAIHYGDINLIAPLIVERRKDDHILWKHI